MDMYVVHLIQCRQLNEISGWWLEEASLTIDPYTRTAT